jgi:hypothetical protein
MNIETKTYKIKIKGISPYMQHRMDDMKLDEWEKFRGKIMERPEVSEEINKRAEYHCFRNNNGDCYIPADHIKGALINAGSYLKAKVGGRSKSMKILVAACFSVSPDEIIIPEFDSIDRRSAVNKNIKARVIVVRPKWIEWEAEFELTIQEKTITKETVCELIKIAGNLVGIGSFRPTNNGGFGRFQLYNIDLVK